MVSNNDLTKLLTIRKRAWLRCNTINYECLWVQWYKYFHEVRDEMFHSTNQMKYLFHYTNKKIIHYLFFKTCTKIQIFKQYWKTTLAQTKHYTNPASNTTREVLRRRLRHAKLTPFVCCICLPQSFEHTLSYQPRC